MRFLPLALTLIAMAVSARPAAGQSFAAPLVPVPSTALSPLPAKDIVTLELDADGVPDIAVAHGDVTLLRAQAGGGYVGTDLIATNDAGRNLRVADMDLDGDDDLVVSGYGHIEVLLLQDGFSFFTWEYPSGGFGLDVGDLDGDGATDVVVADFNLARITVRPGLSFAGLGSPTSFAMGANPYAVALADLDQDGALDVITSDSGGSSVTVRLGNGAGGFGPALTHALAGSPSHMVVTDTNGDGLLDVVVTTPGGLTVLAGDGAGGFSEELALPVPSLVSDLEAHDVDGDGDEDLVLGVGAADGLAVFLATGDGGFEPMIPSLPGYAVTTLAVDDLDLDGRADVMGGIDVPYIMVTRGDGAGSFVQPGSLSFAGDAELVSVADLNGDGLSDVVSTPAAAGVTEVRLGLGDAQFGPPVSSPVAAIDVARFGDLNADGFDDLVTLAGGDVTVRLSDGAGGLLPGVPTPVPDNVMDVGVADWNGDGDQDVVVLTYSVPKGFDDYKRWIGVLPGDGAGGLAPPPGMFLYDVDYPHPPDRLKLGDVNGDGKPDAVVIESFPGQLRVVLGDGAVWFTAGPALWDGMLSNTGEDSMALADLDGDGALDIVARRSGQIRAWSGHGDGTFTGPVTLTSTVPLGGRSVAVDDVDRDGFADVVFDTDSRFGVLHGSAGGGFEPADYARPATSPAGRIFVGSLDGDAFPDVLGVETDGALWPNEPKFPGLSTHRNLAASAQWADLGYGLAGTNGVPKLVGTGTLEAGSPGTLKLSNAHPNKLAVLFISKQSNPAPFKGGILATVPPLISFMLFTNPAGAISLSWSSWPGGAPGSTWYFQYGVVDPGGPAGAALSNALRATQP